MSERLTSPAQFRRSPPRPLGIEPPELWPESGVAEARQPEQVSVPLIAESVLELEGVERLYRVGDVEIRALAGVDLDVPEGDYIAITGPSGSGKSTLMNVLGCLDTPTAGSFRLRGIPLHQLDDRTRAHVRNREIGFVFQSFNLLPGLDALENVELPMVYARVPPLERRRRARLVLERVGLGHRMAHKPSELSGGQCQRVAIARALINGPTILLADEPTGNLDSKTADEIMGLIDEVAHAGCTVIMVTHEKEIAAHARREIAMLDGRIV